MPEIQNEVFTIHECGVYGDMITLSSFETAQETANQINKMLWANKNLIWVNDYQLMDRPGGKVYLRIEIRSVDNPAQMVNMLAEIIKHGWINPNTREYENV